MYIKNFKFINGCKANKDTHKTANIFLTSKNYGAHIIAIHLRNSPMYTSLDTWNYIFLAVILYFWLPVPSGSVTDSTIEKFDLKNMG